MSTGRQSRNETHSHPGQAAVRRPAAVKIRTILGPASPARRPCALYAQVSDALPRYHQQTKNLLVSYSAKKLGFF